MSEFLFDLPDPDPARSLRTFRQLPYPIWTENKARLIERYLYYFVMVTHHGTYIDAFAGPQKPSKLDMWSAKLVLESRPRWFRTFHLFELDPSKVDMLNALIAAQPLRDKSKGEPKRVAMVYAGDFNTNIASVLATNPIKPQEAAFCLLDQRTFECDWSSIKRVAEHKAGTNKIELFYFMPNGWFDRAFSAVKDKETRMRRWLGTTDWRPFAEARGHVRAKMLCDRFKSELGYKHAYPFPIFEREGGSGKTMYFMIHASDHDDATPLMYRAYNKALGIEEPAEQLEFLHEPLASPVA